MTLFRSLAQAGKRPAQRGKVGDDGIGERRKQPARALRTRQPDCRDPAVARKAHVGGRIPHHAKGGRRYAVCGAERADAACVRLGGEAASVGIYRIEQIGYAQAAQARFRQSGGIGGDDEEGIPLPFQPAQEFAEAGLAGKVWQYFVVVPDMRATGVRDGRRAYEWPAVIRAVNTMDAMTATVPELDWSLLKRITDRILAEVPGICRVTYDLTPKPIGTIEWE